MGIGLKLAYLGTSSFAVPTLQQLFETGYGIQGVITQPDKPGGRGQNLQATPVKRKAQELQIPVYQPAGLKDDNARALFTALDADMFVVVAYGKLLPPWLVKLPPYGVINLHGSLLPQYRGAAPIHWAIANGEVETGVCTMQIDEGLDTGPVYLSERAAIGAEDTVQELSQRLAGIGSGLVIRTIEGIACGTLQPTPQDNDRATYAPVLKKQDGQIDWREPAHVIHNKIRAFNPWPGSVTRFRGALCKILKSKPGAAAPLVDPGSIVLSRQSLSVVCGDAVLLELLEVQPENRKPIPATAFANGARITAGDKFEQVGDN